jgi:hypothetical protein
VCWLVHTGMQGAVGVLVGTYRYAGCGRCAGWYIPVCRVR